MRSRRMLRAVVFLGLVSIGAPSTSALAYPPGGLDSFDSSAQVFVTPLPGCTVGPGTLDAVLRGPTTIRRMDPQTMADGTRFFDTEMLQLDLSGTTPIGPLMVRQSPDRRTLGRVTARAPGTDFPADSFFDVFVDMTVAGVTFVNLMPIRMSSVIYSLPPHVFPYLPPPGTCIPFAVKGTTVPVLWMIHAEHTPRTDRKCLPVGGGLTFFHPQLGFMNGKIENMATAQFVQGTKPMGQDHIDTELISMHLAGTLFGERGVMGTFSSSEPPSLGSFGQQAGTQSFFDVFFDLTVEGTEIDAGLRVGGIFSTAGGGSMSGSRPPVPNALSLVGAGLHFGPVLDCPSDYPPR